MSTPSTALWGYMEQRESSSQESTAYNHNIPAASKAAQAWAKAVDDPWDPCILTLDGGGIKGYSSLLILRQLMHEVYVLEHRIEAEEETGEVLPDDERDLLPCHYFDFLYGTSTGGLIAIMLARLRMTVDDCLDTYRVVGDRLFGRRKSRIPFRTKYYHEPLEKAVQEIVDRRKLGTMHPWTKPGEQFGEPRASPYARRDSGRSSLDAQAVAPMAVQVPADIQPTKIVSSAVPFERAAQNIGAISTNTHKRWDPEAPRVAQSCCLTAVHNQNVIRAHLLRSYDHHYTDETPLWITPYNEGADQLEIWQVTRATSAAPFYFNMLQVTLNGQLLTFKDGGLRENNCAEAALSEFRSLYHDNKENPALLLSIGTGRANTDQDGFMTTWPGPLGNLTVVRNLVEKISVVLSLLIKYTESEGKHQSMLNYARGENTWYKRLNVSLGLERMNLDDWVTGPYKGKKKTPGGKTLTRMEEATQRYLDRELDFRFDTYAPPKEMLRQTAEKLVRQRRARRRMGGLRWETFIGKGLE